MTKEESLATEEMMPNERPSPTFSSLPDVVLQHLAPFLIWTSRRSLSQVNHRFRGHFAPLLSSGKSLSIKGQVSVGVGVGQEESVHSASLFEFYTVHIEMCDEMNIYWKMEMESGVRTVVHRQYDGDLETEKRSSVMVSSHIYLENILKWILEKYHFKRIHLGVSGLAPLFSKYNHFVEDVGISDEVEYLELAQKLRPKKLALFPPTMYARKRGVLDFKKFPQLEELIMYGVPLDLDQFVESKLLKVTADTITKKIKLRHASKLIENWKRGHLNYKTIRISSEPRRIPRKVPYQQWNALHDENEETDVFYDDVENDRQKIGSFRYSPKSFEFVSWEENGGVEPSFF